MKQIKLIVSLYLSLMVAVSAQAGDKVGGGGIAVVCGKTEGAVATVKLLDLYQAELGGKKIRRSSDSVEAQLDSTFKNLDPRLKYDLRKIVSGLKPAMLPANILLKKKYDLGENAILIEDGCTLEWVAYYKDGNEELQIVTRLYDQMSNTDKAAILAHEAVYRIRRGMLGEIDSEATRSIVAEMFAVEHDSAQIASMTQDMVVTVAQSVRTTFPGKEMSLRLYLYPKEIEPWELETQFDLVCYDSLWNTLFEMDEVTLKRGESRVVHIQECAALYTRAGSWNYEIKIYNSGEPVYESKHFGEKLVKFYPNGLQ